MVWHQFLSLILFVGNVLASQKSVAQVAIVRSCTFARVIFHEFDCKYLREGSKHEIQLLAQALQSLVTE
jgi:hypothetical protein